MKLDLMMFQQVGPNAVTAKDFWPKLTTNIWPNDILTSCWAK